MTPKPTIILRRTGPNSAAVEYMNSRQVAAAPAGAQANEIQPRTIKIDESEFAHRLGQPGRVDMDDTLAAAQSLCDDGDWTFASATGRLFALEGAMGIRWWAEGTREELVLALCFLKAMRSR